METDVAVSGCGGEVGCSVAESDGHDELSFGCVRKCVNVLPVELEDPVVGLGDLIAGLLNQVGLYNNVARSNC